MKSIGIDIGGTKIAVAAVDGDGRIVAQLRFATDAANGFATALQKIISAVEEVASHAQSQVTDLSGIGIGCAGPVDSIRGTIHNPHTLPTWDDCDLVTPLRERFSVPVRLENDADAAALGEFSFGAGQGASPMVMLTFGTGIGFAAIVEGSVFRGVAGEHPEAGHIATLSDGPECYCGRRGCFESLASGTAIETAGRLAGFSGSHEVFTAAQSGHIAAQSIIDLALQSTASAIWTIAHTFLPERIVLGGGLIDHHFELFAGAARGALAQAVLIPKGRVQVAKASLGASAGVVGAATLCGK
jgi:glucokinase